MFYLFSLIIYQRPNHPRDPSPNLKKRLRCVWLTADVWICYSYLSNLYSFMHCTPLYKIYMYLGLSISFIDINESRRRRGNSGQLGLFAFFQPDYTRLGSICLKFPRHLVKVAWTFEKIRNEKFIHTRSSKHVISRFHPKLENDCCAIFFMVFQIIVWFFISSYGKVKWSESRGLKIAD